MKTYVVSEEEYENLLLLYTKGPTNAQVLPNGEYQKLVDQDLMEVSGAGIAVLTDDGMAYMKSKEDPAPTLTDEQIDASGVTGDKEVAEESDASLRAAMARGKRMTSLECRHVAIEGISDLLKNTMENVTSGFQAFINAIKPNERMVEVRFDKKEMVGKLENAKFMGLSNLSIPTPEGLSTKYLTYIEALDLAVTRAEGINKTLDDFIAFIGTIITNAEERKDSKDSKHYDEMGSSRDAVYSTLAANFNSRREAQNYYGKLVDRNRDWGTIMDKATELNLRINKTSRTELLKKSNHLKVLLVKIRDAANRNGFDQTSPQIIEKISNGSFQVASELEFYVVAYYRVSTFVESINQDCEVLSNVLKLDKK